MLLATFAPAPIAVALVRGTALIALFANKTPASLPRNVLREPWSCLLAGVVAEIDVIVGVNRGWPGLVADNGVVGAGGDGTSSIYPDEGVAHAGGGVIARLIADERA